MTEPSFDHAALIDERLRSAVQLLHAPTRFEIAQQELAAARKEFEDALAAFKEAPLRDELKVRKAIEENLWARFQDARVDSLHFEFKVAPYGAKPRYADLVVLYGELIPIFTNRTAELKRDLARLLKLPNARLAN